MDSRQNVRFLFSGRVQGVGFRATAQHLAGRFAVDGYVRNLDDGRVELVVSGDPGEIDGFVSAIERELGDKIQGVSRGPIDLTTPLLGFTIRY
jgi:acylphosphatase